MSVLVSYTEEDARPHLFDRQPTMLEDAIQAGNAALQLMACALDLSGKDRTDALASAKKLSQRCAALLTREVEGV
jgi:hypothetical protein